MNMNKMVCRLRFVLVAAIALFAASGARSAVGEATPAASSKSYSDTSMWAGGDYPDGRGAVLNIDGAVTFGYNDATPSLDIDVTLGAIRRRADATRQYGIFFIPGIHHGYEISNSWNPMFGAVHSNGLTQAGNIDRNVATNAITMWNTGSEPAVIACETERFDETGSTAATVNTEGKKQFPMWIDVPLVLKSDLLLSHEGVVASQIGSINALVDKGRIVPYAAISLGGNISTPAGEFHDLIVSNPVYRGSTVRGEGSKYIHNAVMLHGENTFRGNVRVKEGVLRLAGEAGIRGTIRQLGDKDNAVYVSGEGAVDLMGGKVPASHHLHLGGLSVSSTFGNLYSSDLDPLANAEWCGPVTLDGPAAIGGAPESVQFGLGSQFWNVVNGSDGNLRVSGAIDGSYGLSIRGSRQVEFAGDNSQFTGSMTVEGTGVRVRFLGARSLPGAGSLVMNGGVVRMCASTDADVSTLGARLDTTTYSKNLLLDLQGDFTYNPSQGFVNLVGLGKCGSGSLLLDKDISYAVSSPTLYLDEGETVFDFTAGATSLWGEPMSGDGNGELHIANDAKVAIKIPAGYGNHGVYKVKVLENMFPRLSIETESDFKIQSIDVNKNGMLMVDPLSGAGSVLVRTGNSGANGRYRPMLYANVLYGETTFACRGGYGDTYGALGGFADEDYATTFSGLSAGAASAADSFVDVTAELVAGGPVSFASRALRFNTPNGGNPIVVDMTGFTNVVGCTILITPNMGSTPVVFRGGALNPASDGCLRIVNLNTNALAYLELDCDVVGSYDETGTFIKGTTSTMLFAGRGRTVFRGGNHLRCSPYFIGSNVELPTVGLMSGISIEGENRLRPFVNNGASFTATEDINLTGTAFYGSNKGRAVRFEPTVGRGGMALGAAEGKTLTIGNFADCYFRDGSRLAKTGAGRVLVSATLFQYSVGLGNDGMTWPADNVFPVERVFRGAVTGGTLESANDNGCGWFFGQRPARIDVSDGVTLSGKTFLMTSGMSGDTCLCDYGRRQSFVVPEGATVTFDRATGIELITGYNKLGNAVPAMYAKGSGHFAGRGTIVVTDSVDATKGIRPMGDAQPNFQGVLRSELRYLGTGDWLGSLGVAYPNATLYIDAGVSHMFSQMYKDYFACRIGALSGGGNYGVANNADAKTGSWTFIGCDDAARSATFSGNVGGSTASPIVKVGKSTQMFTGNDGGLKGSVAVRDGKLVLGSENAFSYSEGNARYYVYVYVGDDKTTAGMEPKFLAQGVATVRNPIRVLGCADASVTPVVGVDSGETSFHSITVSNNVKLVANAAGSRATFDSFTSLGAFDVAVGGAGEVAVSGNVTLAGGFTATAGAAFTTSGSLSVGEGARFSVDIPAELDTERRYTLVSAAGGINGRFDFSGASLPPGWRLSQNGGSVSLSYGRGLSIFVK